MQVKRLLSSATLLGALVLTACGDPTPTAIIAPEAVAGTLAPTVTTTVLTPTPAAAVLPAGATTVPTAPTMSSSAMPARTAGPAALPATSTSASAGPLTKVTLALDWTPNTNHTGFYVALQKGWYREQGIDLQILPYSDAASPDTLVGSGQADFAVSFVEQVVLDRVNGLPVKSVAALVQINTSELVTLKSSGLDRPAKLEGKRYAGFGSPYEEPVISAVIRHDGGKTGAIQNITSNTGGLQALEAKQADFVWIYRGWEAIQARHDGVALNEFLISDYGVPDYYSPVLITSDSFLRNKADLGRRFLAATARGYRLAIQDPTTAADLLIAANPADTFPDKELVRESGAYLANEYQAHALRWGEQTAAAWSGYPKFMLDSGRLEDQNHAKVTTLDYSALFTNSLLPAP